MLSDAIAYGSDAVDVAVAVVVVEQWFWWC
jgi:hypothetical protein